MTAQRDLEAVLSTWLDEGPTELPDATRRAIVTSLPMTPQARRGPFAPWRMVPMNGLARVTTAAVVAAVAIGAAIYVSRPLGVGGPSMTPMETASAAPATRAATASPAASPTEGAIALPSLASSPNPAPADAEPYRPGSLAPGSYSTSAFEPALRFTVGDGWVAPGQDDLDEMSLDRANGNFILVTRVAQVVNPRTHAVEAAPDNLAAWLLANPYFEWSGPASSVTVAGVSGSMVDGRVRAGLEPTDAFAYDTGNSRIVGGDRMRYYVLPLKGPDLVLIVVAQSDAQFAATMAAVQIFLDSLVISTP